MAKKEEREWVFCLLPFTYPPPLNPLRVRALLLAGYGLLRGKILGVLPLGIQWIWYAVDPRKLRGVWCEVCGGGDTL